MQASTAPAERTPTLQLQAIVVERLAPPPAAAQRPPMPGETPLSPAEVVHGTYHGLIGD